MNEKLERALEIYRAGGRASVARDTVAPVLDEIDAEIDAKVFKMLESHLGIDPTFAVQAWMQRYANERLRKMLARNVKRGKAASMDIAPVLNGDQKQ